MKEKLYKGKTLQEVEKLAVLDLGVCKDDLYFDILSEGKYILQGQKIKISKVKDNKLIVIKVID